MSERHAITITGGGLAGLGLGLALRRRGVPVTLYEASHYPRPKVCGEFITGLDAATSATLELGPRLDRHRRHQQVAWFGRQGRVLRHPLPRPAIGVSRQLLDTEMAEAFRAAGGGLQEGRRVDPSTVHGPGQVLACGRRQRPGGWLGLKVHVQELELDGDLEMHLGDGAYVGLSGVEAGRCNVCGLFRPRPELQGPARAVLDRYLRAAGLTHLADRVAAAPADEASRTAVAGVHFGRNEVAIDVVALGDAYAAIPPFTGHGMAMALQGAALALDPLVAWSRGEQSWETTTAEVRKRLQRAFARRLMVAGWLHPWLLARRRQTWLARLHEAGVLPVRLLYHALH